MRLLTIALAALAVAAVTASSAVSAPRPPLIFVLAGQSNMVGYGPLPDTPAPVSPAVSVLVDGASVPLTEPLPDPGNPTIADGYGSGPAVTFANTLATTTGRQIVLIPCAYPGSYLSDWQPGGWLYQRCLSRVGATHVDGMIFLQGEQDTTDPALAATWATRFRGFVSAFRAALEQPRLPIVFGQIGSYADDTHPAWTLVQSQQASVRPARSSMIVTSDLPMQPASLHFALDSYRAIGVRFASAWLRLTAPAPHPHRRKAAK